MITDARPVGGRCRELTPVDLGNGGTWCGMRGPGQSSCFVGGADAVSFFFRLGIKPELGRHFCLPPVSYKVVEKALGRTLTAHERTLSWYPHFSVMPMGWSWSFFFAQAVNVEMVRRSVSSLRSAFAGAIAPGSLSNRAVAPPRCRSRSASQGRSGRT